MGVEKSHRRLVEEWMEAWNSRDLDRIMEHYAPSVEFEANTVIFLSPSGYAVLYRRDNGNRVLDVVELNTNRQAVSVRAYYLGEQA